MIKAEVILASSTANAKTLWTYKIRYPWFIHGECKTHRVLSGFSEEGLFELIEDVGLMHDRNLSRNASSNRAVPLAKMLEEVRSDELRAEPVYWGAEQKGMEPGEALTPVEIGTARSYWRTAAMNAAASAEGMAKNVRVHKSLCNRLLMPFTHANVIVTGTEWENFYGLRLDKAADPTMRALAEAMWAAMNEWEPRPLKPGQWHLPFINWLAGDGEEIMKYSETNGGDVEQLAIKVSVARSARVSYESHDTGKRSTVAEDLGLYDRLVGQRVLHASPAEHQATPDEFTSLNDIMSVARSAEPMFKAYWHHPKEHGNLPGWRQYRKMLAGEAVAPLPEGYKWRET